MLFLMQPKGDGLISCTTHRSHSLLMIPKNWLSQLLYVTFMLVDPRILALPAAASGPRILLKPMGYGSGYLSVMKELILLGFSSLDTASRTVEE